MGDPDPGLEQTLTFRWGALPILSADLPGIGGLIRRHPEDFQVTEVPAYLPGGAGSHVYVLVRKRGLTTRDLVRQLLGQGVPESGIGVAGLKDKYAVTEQWLSLPARFEAAVAGLAELEGVEVLEVSRHRNKLGVGHLRGNRFRVRVREVRPDADVMADAILAFLRQTGLPNYFGPQRFGRFGRNAVDGVRLLRGERVTGDQRLKRFFLSALQSHLFNALLAARIERGLFRAVVPGDWARKHDTGGTFLVEGTEEAARAERLEISATLPLYGRKVAVSGGEAGEIEAEILSRYGLRWIDFRSRRGDRRMSRIVVEQPRASMEGSDLVLEFALPKGSYATCLLREVLKEDVDAPSVAGSDPQEAGY